MRKNISACDTLKDMLYIKKKKKSGSEIIPNSFLSKDEYKDSLEFIKVPHRFFGYLSNSEVILEFV